MFFFGVLPFVYLAPWSDKSINRHRDTALKIHMFLLCLSVIIYVYIRRTYCVNYDDLPKTIRSKSSRELKVKGCKVLHFEPVCEKKRRILLFPGLGISVRRMLQETCMNVFVQDSEIVCFQVRGLGESDWNVDFDTKSMLEDSLNMMAVFDSITDGTLDTLFIGYSLGCFVSMQSLSHVAVCQMKCRNILLVNGMCSGYNIRSDFKVFAGILGLNVKQHLKLSNVPVTVLHARDDVTIPISEALELKQECDAIGRTCNLFIIEGNHYKYQLSRESVSFLRHL